MAKFDLTENWDQMCRRIPWLDVWEVGRPVQDNIRKRVQRAEGSVKVKGELDAESGISQKQEIYMTNALYFN